VLSLYSINKPPKLLCMLVTFIKMSGIDKVMFIVWSIGLIGMITTIVRLLVLCVVSKLNQSKTI
jgi:hypothetical protein